MPDKVDHPVNFTRVGDAVETPDPIGMNVGETAQYSIDGGGKVTVVFSPFDKATIEDGETVTVQREGHFLCQVLVDGKPAKWTRGLGADHDVPKK
jgi:hypothetical protein